MSARPILVWFRQDLRTADQPALATAAASGRPVVPLFVLDDDGPGRRRIGGAGRWWLAGSLEALAADLAGRGSPLVLRRGPAVATIRAVAAETGAAAVNWTRHVEPHWRAAEAELARVLAADGVEAGVFDGVGLFPPGRVLGREGRPIRVFTPFWRTCLALPPPPRPGPAPAGLIPPPVPVASESLADWQLRPSAPDWAAGLRATWTPGEAAAMARLAAFHAGDLAAYARDRNRPEPTATSLLSPHLHWGEISPAQVWHATLARTATAPALAAGADSFLRELGWREFCLHTLWHSPAMADEPLQSRFADFPWRPEPALLRAWQRGLTGYPIVDAGMRQLWHTGWMHNRVRMVVASFLVKHLLQPWQAGEAWFWDTLVDADLANNAGGWQWVAGCGTDAAPYFRIFNPVTQGERFDADGAYVRRWLPALARLPERWIQRPWEAPALELAAAGVRIGIDYPRPLVDHVQARDRALAAFAHLKAAS
jgi:deoxyribodipyrimidine photo-lyase